MHPIHNAIYRFNLCLLNLIGVALFLGAAYDIKSFTHWGSAISEFCGFSLLVAISGILMGVYRLAQKAQWFTIAGPLSLLYLFLREITSENFSSMSFLLIVSLLLLGYFTALALAVGKLARQQTQ